MLAVAVRSVKEGDVAGVLILLVGGVAQDFNDDRVVELRVQIGVEEVDGEGQEGTSRSRKREASQRECAMDDMEMVMKRLRLEPMRCEMTSPGVEEYAICASSAHDMNHANVCVNVVIDVLVVICELHVDVSCCWRCGQHSGRNYTLPCRFDRF